MNSTTADDETETLGALPILLIELFEGAVITGIGASEVVVVAAAGGTMTTGDGPTEEDGTCAFDSPTLLRMGLLDTTFFPPDGDVEVELEELEVEEGERITRRTTRLTIFLGPVAAAAASVATGTALDVELERDVAVEADKLI